MTPTDTRTRTRTHRHTRGRVDPDEHSTSPTPYNAPITLTDTGAHIQEHRHVPCPSAHTWSHPTYMYVHVYRRDVYVHLWLRSTKPVFPWPHLCTLPHSYKPHSHSERPPIVRRGTNRGWGRPAPCRESGTSGLPPPTRPPTDSGTKDTSAVLSPTRIRPGLPESRPPPLGRTPSPVDIEGGGD